MVPGVQQTHSTMRDYGRVLRRRKGILVFAVLATMIPAVTFSLLQDPVYTAEAQMLIRSAPGDSLFESSTSGGSDPERAAENAIRVLQGEVVREQLRTDLGLTTDPPSVSASADGTADVVVVRVRNGDAEVAADLANGYVQAYITTQRAQASEGLEAAAAQLTIQIEDLRTRIADVDAQIAASVATRDDEITTRRAQVRDLETQRSDLEIQVNELDLAGALTADELTLRRQLLTAINDLDGQIEVLDDEIRDFEQQDDAVLERSRQALFDQESDFITRLDELTIDAALASGGAVLLAPAVAPDDPTSPKPITAALLALLAGLVIGAAAAFLIDYFDDSITSPADLGKLSTSPTLLAAVPDEPSSEGRPISITKPETFAVEAYRTLRTNIQFLGLERRMQVIEITSAVPGEGKSTTAANLAVVLSQTGSSVILVDADLRKPSVHRMFHIDRTFGLTNNLAGETVDMTIQQVGDHLDVLVAGPIPPNPSEMLSGRRMGALVDELRTRYDYVVIDAAPALAVSDALALAQHVDGVVVVVQAGRITVPRLRNTLEMLEQVSAPVVGIVLNKADPHLGDLDDYQYGVGYGQVYGQSKPERTAGARR